MTHLVRFAIALIAVCMIGETAIAAPPELSADAKLHSDAGVAAYNAGDFVTASREFEAAYGIDPEPLLLYAWAQARRKGDHCTDAIALYRRYLDTNPTADQSAAANTGISLCHQASPPPTPPAPPPPPQREPVKPESQRQPSPWYADRLGGALTIGGTVTAAVGTTFLVLAQRSEDAANRAEFRDEFVERFEEASLRRRLGITGVGIGAALVIAGIVRYATRRDEPANVTLTITTSSLVVAGRF